MFNDDNNTLNNFPQPGQTVPAPEATPTPTMQPQPTPVVETAPHADVDLDSLIANAQPVESTPEYSKLPEGTYPCIVYDAKYGVSKTGKSMFTITYKIKGGAYEGQNIIENFILSGISDQFLAMNANNLTNRIVNTFGIAKNWKSMGEMEQTIASFVPQMGAMIFNISIYYAINAKTNEQSEYSTIEKIERA